MADAAPIVPNVVTDGMRILKEFRVDVLALRGAVLSIRPALRGATYNQEVMLASAAYYASMAERPLTAESIGEAIVYVSTLGHGTLDHPPPGFPMDPSVYRESIMTVARDYLFLAEQMGF